MLMNESWRRRPRLNIWYITYFAHKSIMRMPVQFQLLAARIPWWFWPASSYYHHKHMGAYCTRSRCPSPMEEKIPYTIRLELWLSCDSDNNESLFRSCAKFCRLHSLTCELQLRMPSLPELRTCGPSEFPLLIPWTIASRIPIPWYENHTLVIITIW